MKTKSSKNDLTVPENQRFRTIEKAFLSRCRHFGYKEVKTSTIEPLHIFTALGALSETKLRRMYSFLDWDGWSGERVSLKSDSTTCVARFYSEKLYDSNPKQKLCYVENHFELSDAGDDISERWQCGIENIGNDSVDSDIETIYMAYDILKELVPEPIYLYLSYPAIIKEFVETLELFKPREEELISAIHNNQQENIKNILALVHDSENLSNLLTIKGVSANYLKNFLEVLQIPKYKKIRLYLKNFISICELLDQLECPYIIDFSLLGDIEYYTGIQFQILSTSVRKAKTDVLCAGGRYDRLMGDMLDLIHSRSEKNQIPSVGFALYVRNLINNPMKSQEQTSDHLHNMAIYISHISKRNVKTAQLLSDKFFQLGFLTQITFARIAEEQYADFGLVIEVDHDRFPDGYQVLSSQKIGKPLLKHLFGEFNG